MGSARIEQVFDGTLRAVHPGAPLLLSSATAWSGFLLERDLCRAGRAESLHNPHASIVLAEGAPIEVEDHALRQEPRFVARGDSITLWPAGHESRSIRWRPSTGDGPAAVMVRVQLDATTLQRLAPDNDALWRRPLQQRAGVHDAPLVAMVRLMAGEIAMGCPGGPLFGEYLCLALAAHVSQCHGAAAPASVAPGGLSRRQMEEVQTLIEANLGAALGLAQLAAAAGLGPSRFVTAFRRSTGTTPHQYLLRMRVDRARLLLAHGDASVAEIGLLLGFASQSHFTEVFRRFVGTTPARFRQAR